MTIDPKTSDWRSEFKRLEGAYAPATMRSYYADVEAFEGWCVENRISEPFPASVETLCRFLEDQGQSKAPSTVRRRLYAIRKVHRLLRLPDPTYDEEINLAFRKVRRGHAVRPRQDKVIDRCLETTTVRRVIKEAARRCDLRAEHVESFSGHSMRVGAAQDLLTRGFDTAAIMRAGGWKSVNVLARYLEKAEQNVWA